MAREGWPTTIVGPRAGEVGGSSSKLIVGIGGLVSGGGLWMTGMLAGLASTTDAGRGVARADGVGVTLLGPGVLARRSRPDTRSSRGPRDEGRGGGGIGTCTCALPFAPAELDGDMPICAKSRVTLSIESTEPLVLGTLWMLGDGGTLPRGGKYCCVEGDDGTLLELGVMLFCAAMRPSVPVPRRGGPRAMSASAAMRRLSARLIDCAGSTPAGGGMIGDAPGGGCGSVRRTDGALVRPPPAGDGSEGERAGGGMGAPPGCGSGRPPGTGEAPGGVGCAYACGGAALAYGAWPGLGGGGGCCHGAGA
jgi:hypothetical protein